MKVLIYAGLLVHFCFIGCGTAIPKPPSEQPLHATKRGENLTESSGKSEGSTPKNELKHVKVEDELSPLAVEVAGMKFMVTINDIGDLTILDYPSSWQGKAKLVRFDGLASWEPLSAERCQTIRFQASSGLADLLVRGPYHSDLIFEMPPYLSSDFMPAIREAAKAAGLPYHALYLTNPVDTIHGDVEVTFTDQAISHHIGRYQELFDQINLSKSGVIKGQSERMVIVTSGDIICDLMSGDAKMTMIYHVKNEDRVVRVSYSPLEIKLDVREG